MHNKSQNNLRFMKNIRTKKAIFENVKPENKINAYSKKVCLDSRSATDQYTIG